MSHCVLLVEDNALNLELHRDLLEASACTVVVASTVADARALLAAGLVPDVALLDILLPDGSGIDVYEALRHMAHLRHVPVIAVTAQALTGDVPRLLAAGFDAVITKPIDTRTFSACVTQCRRRPEASP